MTSPNPELLPVPSPPAPGPAAGEPGRAWWQDGVVYQIYPRSFADSNGDGIGDLGGITEHLDHLNGAEHSLGVDAIWLSPIYPSPMKDFGYDVSDYTAISPEFGTLADFRRLIEEAHRRRIRVILDLVLNHCSDQHPWFVEARSSRTSPKRDWFIWHDGHQGTLGRRPPNNWCAAFGGRAWQWDARTRQYYLHSFLPEQPDFNWRNPDAKRALLDVMRFWLDLGVDGFRLDVVNWFLKDSELRDNPERRALRRRYDRQTHVYDRNRPETVDVMREIRVAVDAYPERMTVGEVFVEPPGDPALPAEYYAEGQGLHLAFNFAFLYCRFGAESFARAIERWEALLGPGLWPNYTLSNHDQARSFTRHGKHGDAPDRARVAAALLLTLRGTPFLYYGEELGMQSLRIPRAQLRDPLGRRYWPFHPGRDPARTPMQWSDGQHAGFSTCEPWLPVNSDHVQVNVERQQRDAGSLLSWYRRLLACRRGEPALRRGSYRRLPVASSDVLAFERTLGSAGVVVLLNFSARRTQVTLRDRAFRVLVSTSFADGALLAAAIPLEPYGVIVARREERSAP